MLAAAPDSNGTSPVAATIIQAEQGRYEPMPAIPAMLSEDEKYLYHKTAGSYRGKGAVIEIGPWLGASTYQICSGLATSGHDWSLTVLDRFKWSPLYANGFPKVDLKRGDSFLPLFREHLSPYSSKINVLTGEVLEIEELLQLSESVELLFIDAPKSWRMLWTVFNHLGPRLQRGSRVLMQDFLHITSRQIAWLAASIPELEAMETVGDGTSVVFTVSKRLTSFGQDLPSDMREVPSTRLIELWERMASMLPEARASDLGAGLALDLLERGETKLACAVLDRAVRGTTREAALTEELLRLLRKSPGSVKGYLLEVIAYLRADADPAAIRRARLRQEAAPSPAFESADPLATLDRDAALEVAKSLASPRTASQLAIRHGAVQGVTDETAFRSLFRAFGICAEIGLPEAAAEITSLLPGAHVVELGSGIALNGLVLRALGAAHYTGVLGEGDLQRRVYRNPFTLLRAKTSFTPGDIAAMDGGLTFVESVDSVAVQSADLLILRPEPNEPALGLALELASRLLKPGGHLRLTWRNPRSWAGHGRPPQTVAEMVPDDEAQQKLLDWRHIALVRSNVPSLNAVRERIGGRLKITDWQENLDDPAALIRLTPRVQNRHPMLRPEDFTCRSVTVMAEA